MSYKDELNERAGVTHKVQTCLTATAYLFIYLFESLRKGEGSLLVNILVGLWFKSSLLEEWGQIRNIFPRGGMKYKTHAREHFISLF